MSVANIALKALLLDLDGTLYVGDTALPGAITAVDQLRKRGVPIRYLTNTTSKPRDHIVGHAAALGLEIDPSHLYTPPLVARDVLQNDGHRRCHFLLRPEVIADIDGVEHVDDRPDAVVIGDLGDRFTPAHLDRALRWLLDGAAFYTLAANRYYRAADGMRLDVGAYTAALEFATGRKATLLGKPSARFFTTPLADLGVAAADAIMVGDDIEGDVAGAQAAGIRGVLVQTGKFRPGDLNRGIMPDAVFDDFATLAAALAPPGQSVTH